MKLKQEFVLRRIGADYILVPVASGGDTFAGLISFNETGAFIWQQIESGKNEEEIVAALLEEYEVEPETASAHVAKQCDDLRKLGILE